MALAFVTLIVGLLSGTAPRLDAGAASSAQRADGDGVDALRTWLDSQVPKLLSQFEVPSAAVALIEGGRVNYVRTFRKDDTGPAVTGDSVFGVASISKMVTAWGVMHLVSTGQVALDAPVAQYLSVSHRLPQVAASPAITVRQLLSHTSGLGFRSAADYWPGDTLPSLEQELATKLPSGQPMLRPIAAPGSTWNYSSGGYGLLQWLIEDVSGTEFSRYMHDAVFRPLGMEHSFYGNPETVEPGRTVRHVDESGKAVRRLGYANLAAGALYTTIDDLARLALADITREGHGVIRATEIDSMHEPAPGSQGTFGLGYFIEHLSSGEAIVGHDGSDVGWTAMFREVPSRQSGFLMLTSSSTGIAAYSAAICQWYQLRHGEARPDYCRPSPFNVVVSLYRGGLQAGLDTFRTLKSEFGARFMFPPAYWTFVADSMLQRREPEEALSLLELLSRVAPAPAGTWTSLGNAYRETKRCAEAKESYSHALSIDPNLAEALAGLASLPTPCAGTPR